MAIVMLIPALGLGIAAFRTRDRGLRLFWGAASAFNLIAAVVMIDGGDEYAFHLRPDDGNYERSFRR